MRFQKGESLDALLPEVYASVREASLRVNGERHFDVQMMAAISLHQGKVAEQRTGEGKTLSASPALFLNAIAGRGAHLVTVNDYLARRACSAASFSASCFDFPRPSSKRTSFTKTPTVKNFL